MNILLANSPSPYIRCRWDIKYDRHRHSYLPFPTRIAYATALLKKLGYNAHVIDGMAEEMTRKEFVDKVKKMKIDLLIWETTVSSFDYDVNTMKMIRRELPKIKIGASGYHASALYKECLKAGYDYVIVGECEYSILDLVRYLNNQIDAFPKGVVDKRHKLKPRPLIENLDDLPFPERDELPIRKYNDPKLYGFNIVMISTRGCPWGCSFCTVPIYYGKPNFRVRNPNSVVDEMEYLWNKYRPDELYFDDDNFAVSEKHVEDICNEILRRKLKMRWNCMCDARVSTRLMKLMKKAGCAGITIGAESADPLVLSHLGKPITRYDIRRFAETCESLGLKSHICWVLGLPYSTKQSDLETIKFALTIPSFTMQFSICMPFPGTKMNEWCAKNHYLVKDWKKKLKGNERCIVNYPSYSYEDIEKNVEYAKREWNKKMLRKPSVLYYHLFNIYRYRGISGVLELISIGVKNLFK